MRNYTFEQLKEDIKYFFDKGLRDNENSVIEAATYCFYAYEGMNENSTEFILYALMIGINMVENGSRMFIGQLNLINNAIDKIINQKVILDISSQELNEAICLAKQLQQGLPKMEIVYDPSEK
jgi:hypothetical protein